MTTQTTSKVTAKGKLNGHDIEAEVINPGDWFGNSWLIEIGLGYSSAYYVVEAGSCQDALDEFADSDIGIKCIGIDATASGMDYREEIPAGEDWGQVGGARTVDGYVDLQGNWFAERGCNSEPTRLGNAGTPCDLDHCMIYGTEGIGNGRGMPFICKYFAHFLPASGVTATEFYHDQSDCPRDVPDSKFYFQRLDNAALLQTLDEFTRAYIEAALWSSTEYAFGTCEACGRANQHLSHESKKHDECCKDCGEREQDNPPAMDSNYNASDLLPEALRRMIVDCIHFQGLMGDALRSATCTAKIDCTKIAYAGHDFWLTRNGHGCGFWDGDWSEPEATLLDECAKQFRECDLGVGDDGLLYL